MDPPFLSITDSVSLMKQRKQNKDKDKDRRLALWRSARREDYFEDTYDSMYTYTSNHGAFHSPIKCESDAAVRSPETNAFHKNEYDPRGASMYDYTMIRGGYASPMRPNIERKIDFKDAKIDNPLRGVSKMQPLQPIPREIEVNIDSRSTGIPRKIKGDKECFFHNEQVKPLQTHALLDDSYSSSDCSRMNIVSNEKINPIFSCLKKKRKVDHNFLPFGGDTDLE